MIQILVIGTNDPHSINESGKSLVRFFRAFPSYVNVRFFSGSEYDHLTEAYDDIIIFPNTHFDPTTLETMSYRHVILAEYTDSYTMTPHLLESFGHIAVGMMMPYFLRSKDYPLPTMPMPLAFRPIKRSRIQWLDWPLKHRPYDFSFVGAPNRLYGEYPQRLEWLNQVVALNQYRYRVGFFGVPASAPFHHPQLGPYIYSMLGLLSKVALTPAGNARWTYRHYESMMSRTVMVSTDLSDLDLFIPITESSTIPVQDHHNPVNDLVRVLDRIETYQAMVDHNKTIIDSYLVDGLYGESRPRAIRDYLNQRESLFTRG